MGFVGSAFFGAARGIANEEHFHFLAFAVGQGPGEAKGVVAALGAIWRVVQDEQRLRHIVTPAGASLQERTAVRTLVEEVGLDPSTIDILGRLPAFYIPPSRFWLSAVVARWNDPHPLVPAEAETRDHPLTVRSGMRVHAAPTLDQALAALDPQLAWIVFGEHLPAVTLQVCEVADAILKGPFGGPRDEINHPKWQGVEQNAILPLRKHFDLYLNLRPVIVPAQARSQAKW